MEASMIAPPTAIWRKPAACVALALLAGQWPAAAAGLKWDATEVTLALRWNADSGIARFTFVNEGPGPVRIIEVTPGCGCTAARPTKTTFAAGEKGKVAVEFKAGSRTGTLRVTVVEGPPVAIGEVKVENPAFSATLEPYGPGGREFDLVVTPPAGEVAAFSSIVRRARLGEAQLERAYPLLARTL
jgi:hypothetical protein